MTEIDAMTYHIATGTVQAVVRRRGDATHQMFIHHFGRPEYDIMRPILTTSLITQAQPIVDQLNRGEITEAQAIEMLDRIWY